MTGDEFRDIFNNGLEIEVEGDESEITCFDCNKQNKLESTGRRADDYIVNCEENHEWELIDFTTKWINARDGLLKLQLDNACSFNFQREAEKR